MHKPKNFNEVLNFEEHYTRFILPLLNTLEKDRIKAILTIITALLAGFAFFAIALYYKTSIPIFSSLPEWSIPISLLIFITLSITSWIYIDNYKTKTKEKIFNILFSFLGNFKYQKKQNVALFNFRHIDFLPYYDISDIEDYIKGTYKNLNLAFEEICLQKRYRDTKGNTHYVTVFDGLLILAPQLKQTNANITIKNKNYKQAINKNQEVKLEDVEFNKLYKVSTTDQIEARYILTPAFMEKLKILHQKNICVAISFQQGDIIIAMKKKKNLFEPPLWTTAKNINAYREILSQISEVLKIIDTLQLNTKPKL